MLLSFKMLTCRNDSLADFHRKNLATQPLKQEKPGSWQLTRTKILWKRPIVSAGLQKEDLEQKWQLTPWVKKPPTIEFLQKVAFFVTFSNLLIPYMSFELRCERVVSQFFFINIHLFDRIFF
jgi:hypothetical protein